MSVYDRRAGVCQTPSVPMSSVSSAPMSSVAAHEVYGNQFMCDAMAAASPAASSTDTPAPAARAPAARRSRPSSAPAAGPDMSTAPPAPNMSVAPAAPSMSVAPAASASGAAPSQPSTVSTVMNRSGQAGGAIGLGLDVAGDAAGRLGALGRPIGGLGAVTGAYGMYTAGADMAENGVGLQNGADMAFNAAGTYAGTVGALGMTGTGAGTALGAAGGLSAPVGTALGASAAGTAGLVLGAGAAGYGVGTVANDMATSDHARRSRYGVDDYGRVRTANDAVIDGSVALGQGVERLTGSETLGMVVGGTTAMAGAVLAAPLGVADAVTGWIGSRFRRD
jgi:hypothetical protein